MVLYFYWGYGFVLNLGKTFLVRYYPFKYVRKISRKTNSKFFRKFYVRIKCMMLKEDNVSRWVLDWHYWDKNFVNPSGKCVFKSSRSFLVSSLDQPLPTLNPFWRKKENIRPFIETLSNYLINIKESETIDEISLKCLTMSCIIIRFPQQLF